MKYFIPVLVAIFLPMIAFCQDITGLWKGTMYNDSTKSSLPYELFITKDNGKFTGYTHSWFLIDGQQYYGIKKVAVRIAKDGKVVIQDATIIDNNYPVAPDKNVFQLNVLDIANSGEEATLDGPFVTNRSKKYAALTGHINVKKASLLSQSDLLAYLQKSGIGSNLTVSK